MTPEQIERVMELVEEYGNVSQTLGVATVTQHRYRDEVAKTVDALRDAIEAALKGESTDGTV